MKDQATASLKKDPGNDVRSAYERVEEIVQRVRPFVKVRRLVTIPKRREWRREPS